MDERPTESARDNSDDVDDVQADEIETDDPDDFDSDDADDFDSGDEIVAPGPGGDIEELVRFVATRLVQNPENISVDSSYRGGTVYVSLRVPESEMGRVIGREGRTAKAIRTLVSIAGSRQNVHARLDIDG